jgi:hypothetical protein
LWEIIAIELNGILKASFTASHCENKWRVLDRGYKKYCDNKNKTGRGRKYFEFAEEMDRVFQKKRNVHPEVLLATDTLAPVEEVEAILSTSISAQSSSLPPKDCEPTPSTSRKHKVKSTILNRNKIIEEMRQDRNEYYKARVKIEQEKLEIEKQKVQEMKTRNELIKCRNELLQLMDVQKFNC